MKKRIRFLINTLEGGGAEKVLVNLVGILPQDEYDVTVVSVTGGVFEKSLPAYVNYKKIVKTNNPFLKKFFEKLVCKLPYSVFNSLFLKGEYDIEAAYIHGFPTRVIAKKCGSKAKTLAFVHGDFSKKFSVESLYKSNEECLEEYKKFDRVCFVSSLALDGFKKRLGDADNLSVVHNIIDYRQVMKSSLEEPPVRFETDGLKIVTVGRLTDVKGYRRLIECAGKLEEKYSFELIIVGDGEEKAELEKQIADNGINSVRLVGFYDNPYCIIAQADWYICSSYQEAYNTAIAESISLGIPALTTDCAGMDEILENGKLGIICENSDEALYNALEKLFDSTDYAYYKKNATEKSAALQSSNPLGDYEKLLSDL